MAECKIASLSDVLDYERGANYEPYYHKNERQCTFDKSRLVCVYVC